MCNNWGVHFACQNDCSWCHLFQFDHKRLKCFSISMKPPKCGICFPKAEGQNQRKISVNILEITKFGYSQYQEDFNSGSLGERK